MKKIINLSKTLVHSLIEKYLKFKIQNFILKFYIFLKNLKI